MNYETLIPLLSISPFWKVSKSRPREGLGGVCSKRHQPGLGAATCSVLFLCHLKGQLFLLWLWWPITWPKGSFLFSVWVLFKAIYLGSPCQWAATLEQCSVCIYRLKSFSFWLCLLHFKELMQYVTMTAFLDGCINKVTSTFTTWNKPRIAEGTVFQIVPVLFKETSKNE